MTLKEQIVFKMKELEIAPKRSMGQNFLISEHVVNEIWETVRRLQPSYIVEVGPGLGSLTEGLIESQYPHVLIELDRKIAEYWRKRNAKVVETDALKTDWDALHLPKGALLLSNLPYQIGARLLVELSAGRAEPSDLILMFQEEVTDRLVSEPKTKDYGFLSVVAQTFWSISRVVDASPDCFYPAPNVRSRVVHMRRKKCDAVLGAQFIQFVKKAFQFRRKYMTKSFGSEADKIVPILIEMGKTNKARAEELSVPEFQELYKKYLLGLT